MAHSLLSISSSFSSPLPLFSCLLFLFLSRLAAFSYHYPKSLPFITISFIEQYSKDDVLQCVSGTLIVPRTSLSFGNLPDFRLLLGNFRCLWTLHLSLSQGQNPLLSSPFSFLLYRQEWTQGPSHGTQCSSVFFGVVHVDVLH